MTRAFSALRDLVLADPAAQARLRGTRDWDDFTAAAGELAVEHGIAITPRDLADARADAQRDRVGRGI